MEKKREVVRRLRELEMQKQTVQTVEQALQMLTPEERLVIQMTLICPEKGNVQRLCELLAVEQSSVYRRRDRALEKLEKVLYSETAFEKQNLQRFPVGKGKKL